MKQWLKNSVLVQAFSRPSREATSEELFVGVEKPTTILAKMFKAEILQNLEVAPDERTEEVKGSRNGYRHYRTYVYPRFTLLFIKYEWRDGYGDDSYALSAVTDKNKKRIDFDKDERDILTLAIRSVNVLRAKKKENDAEAARQQSAVDAIENLFKQEPKDADLREAR